MVIKLANGNSRRKIVGKVVLSGQVNEIEIIKIKNLNINNLMEIPIQPMVHHIKILYESKSRL